MEGFQKTHEKKLVDIGLEVGFLGKKIEIMLESKFDQGYKGLRIAQICQICNNKIWTNQKPLLWSCDF